MTNSEQAIREFAEKWGPTFTIEKGQYSDDKLIELCLSGLTALISEHYVAKEDAGYPLEFIEWLIKDQEIFFGELNEEYNLMTTFM